MADIVAFTGTRNGLTPAQREALRGLLANLPADVVLHNGCAEGADEECLDLFEKTHPNAGMLDLWPGSSDRLLGFVERFRATCASPARLKVHSLSRPLERNGSMVAACSMLIACPEGPEVLRSGTWSTIRAARKAGREVVIVWPDGTVEREVLRGR